MTETQPSGAPLSGQALAARVGERIRDLRLARARSLNELASACRIGAGTLSELERGQRNPTLATLFAIAAALDVPLGALLPSAHPHPPLITGDSVRAFLLDRWVGSRASSETYRLSIEERTQVSEPHRAGVRETLTVLDGAVRIGPVDDPVLLRAGESHTFTADRRHGYAAVGAQATAILTMRYPAPGDG